MDIVLNNRDIFELILKFRGPSKKIKKLYEKVLDELEDYIFYKMLNYELPPFDYGYEADDEG